MSGWIVKTGLKVATWGLKKLVKSTKNKLDDRIFKHVDKVEIILEKVL